MKNPGRSQTIIITTIIFYLVVIIVPGDNFPLPMIANIITELTSLTDGYDKEAMMNGGIPLAAVMILIIATSERIMRKDLLYMLSVCMLCPSVLQAFKENKEVNGWSIMTLSVVPFCIVAAVGFAYFIYKLIKRLIRK